MCINQLSANVYEMMNPLADDRARHGSDHYREVNVELPSSENVVHNRAIGVQAQSCRKRVASTGSCA